MKIRSPGVAIPSSRFTFQNQDSFLSNFQQNLGTKLWHFNLLVHAFFLRFQFVSEINRKHIVYYQINSNSVFASLVCRSDPPLVTPCESLCKRVCVLNCNAGHVAAFRLKATTDWRLPGPPLKRWTLLSCQGRWIRPDSATTPRHRKDYL